MCHISSPSERYPSGPLSNFILGTLNKQITINERLSLLFHRIRDSQLCDAIKVNARKKNKHGCHASFILFLVMRTKQMPSEQ